MIALLIPGMKVSGANAANGRLAVGYPAMTAFHGLSMMIARNLSEDCGEKVSLNSFAVMHHDAQPRFYGASGRLMTEKRNLHVSSARPSHGNWFSPPGQINPQVDLKFTLVLRLEADETIEARLKEEGRLRLPLRALGGIVESHGTPRFAYSVEEVLKRGRRGLFLVDCTEELFPEDGRDALDVMLDKLSSREEKARRLMPSHTGYLGLSPAARRTEARGSVDHIHGEPIMGLVEFERFHLVFAGEAPAVSRPAFWQATIDRDSGIHVIKGVL